MPENGINTQRRGAFFMTELGKYMCRKLAYIGLLLVVLSLNQPAFGQVSLAGSWETGTSHAKENGTNRVLIFIAQEESVSGDPNLTSVTYGGQTMTKVIERSAVDGYGNYVAAFILKEAGVAAASSGTFTPTWSATTSSVSYASVFLSNVDQTTSIGASASNGTTSGTDPIATSALATNAGDMAIVGAVCNNADSYILGGGFTEGTDQTAGGTYGHTGVTGHKPATGANETPSADYSGTVSRQAIIGFVVQGTPSDPNKASNPDPANGATNISVTTNFSWIAGAGATSHDVYFGTNSNAHNNPKHTVYTTSYDPPGDLAEGTVYYWAVDSNAGGTVTAGDDWSFTTYEPINIGDLVAEYIISQALTTNYASACSYYGVLVYSEVTGNTGLKNSVIAKYPSVYYTGAELPPEGDVDKNVYGILPFELYRQTRDANYLTSALYLADEEFTPPRPDGLSPYTRFWIDDTYMIGSLQAQAYKSMADIIYANRAVTQLLGYMGEVENLQQPNGLFYHTLSAPIHWGRGNGWAAAAMTEVLSCLHEDDPNRPLLLTKYQNMMAGLIACQDVNGMWYQVLDMSSDPRNWVETSCTGMFVFALATGVKEGWLSEVPYKQAALNGWAALANFVNANGAVREVCPGTGASSNVADYFNKQRNTGDAHGQAAVIWAATAIGRLEQSNLNGDIDGDSDVDFYDLKVLTDNWLDDEPAADIFPAEGDGIINLLDFAELAQDWRK
jgi:rhamnogalacturonyl hydrolase YesR